jgi:hypothetical protein
MPSSPRQLPEVIKAVGKRGEHLGTPVNNPEVGIGSDTAYLDLRIIVSD